MAIAVLILVTTPVTGYAFETVFLRANDLATMEARSVQLSAGAETGERYSSEDREFRDKITYRFSGAMAITDALNLSVLQVVKYHPDEDETELGVFRPELRVTFSKWMDNPWADYSAWSAWRRRVNGRRPSSMIFGLGLAKSWSRTSLTANVGMEVSQPNDTRDRRELGPRYDFGLSYLPLDRLHTNLEVWGHWTWDDAGFYWEQEHHVGPALHYQFERFRAGAMLHGGWQDRPFGGEVWSVTGMLQFTLKI